MMFDDLPRILREDDTPYCDPPDHSWWLGAWVLSVASCLGLLWLARASCIDVMPFEQARCIAAAEVSANAAPDKIGTLIRGLRAEQ